MAESLQTSSEVVRSRFPRFAAIALLLVGLAIGFIAGTAGIPGSSVHADVTEEPRRDTFKAGGVLNEPVLREISATLKRMETRLEQIERNTANRK